MARKSRKNIPEVVSSATVQTEMSRPFRAGLYARISMETEETLERGTIEDLAKKEQQRKKLFGKRENLQKVPGEQRTGYRKSEKKTIIS